MDRLHQIDYFLLWVSLAPFKLKMDKYVGKYILHPMSVFQKPQCFKETIY